MSGLDWWGDTLKQIWCVEPKKTAIGVLWSVDMTCVINIYNNSALIKLLTGKNMTSIKIVILAKIIFMKNINLF